MLATISDCLLRKGFFTGSARRRLSLPVVTGGGVIIGTIAALLGVGGSVMTVPLLRRHGYAMQACIAYPCRRSRGTVMTLPPTPSNAAIVPIITPPPVTTGRDRRRRALPVKKPLRNKQSLMVASISS